MILHIGAIKGGVGKTTIAVNLAAWLALKNHKVLLVDTDLQMSASTFTQVRQEILGSTGYTLINLFGKNVRDQILKMKDQYDYIVIDTGGRDSQALRAAMSVADKTIIPVVPRSLDIWTLPQIVELVNEIRAFKDLQVYTVCNNCDYKSQDNRDLMTALEDIQNDENIIVVPKLIVRRKTVSNKLNMGLSIFEGDELDDKAIDEFESTFNYILEDGKN